MQVVMRESADEAARFAARLVAHALHARPGAVLGLATGRTMEPLYRELGRLHRDESLDFGAARSFNLDEYVGLDALDPRSFRYIMRHHFARVVNIDAARIHVPAGDAPEPAAEAARYERCIAAAGGIDLQLLGVGENGHIGFNEPGTSHAARTHVASLTTETRRQNASMFDGEDAVPRRAITMGIGTILDARRIVLLATGASKAAILAQALRGPVTRAIPCSALQRHPDCVVVVDAEAGAGLSAAAARPARCRDRADP